jgi:hypothetical protein
MSPRKLIPLLLVLAVLVAGLLPFLAPDPAPDLDGGNVPHAEARPKGVTTLPHTAPPPTADQSRPSDIQDRQPIDAPANQPRTEIVILRADTREPVGGATVLWWPMPATFDAGRTFDRWLERSEVEDHAAEAVRLRANAQGRVLVADVEPGFFVAVSAPRLWGCAAFPHEREGPGVVLLDADVNVRVQVVDGSGAPVAGVPIALRERRLASVTDHLTARTGEDGIATLRHAGAILSATVARAFVVAVQGLFEPPIEKRLEPNALPREPVLLVMGPNGACEVAVVDARGQPVGGPIEARLGFADAVDRGLGETMLSRVGGRVVFERVAAGRPLIVEVTREGAAARLEARGPGPRAGARIQLLVPVDPGASILRGRVVDRDGKPLAGDLVRARLEAAAGEPGNDGTWELQTESDGRFSVEIPPAVELPAGLQLVVCRLDASGAEVAGARRPLPRELGAGSHELGDFALAEAPVVAAGIVVDAGGAPIERAVVTPSLPASDERGVSTPGGQDWLVPVRSDATGRFEIRGMTQGLSIALTPSKPGFIGDPVVAHRTDSAVKLVLSGATVIAGTVLLDPSLRGSMVLVQAMREAAAGAAADVGAGHAVVGGDGAFSLNDLPAGTWSVRIVYAATAIELGRVDGVVSHRSQRDPRLDPLDLRNTLKLIVLEPVDERGRRVAGVRAFSRESREPEGKWVPSVESDGMVQLLSSGSPLDVAMAAPGFRHTEIERVAASQRVVLQRAARLRVTLTSGLPELTPPLRLGVKLTPRRSGRFPGFVEPTTAFFTGGSALTCETAFVGEVGVELFVAAPPSRIAAVDGAATTIRVADHGAEQVFWLGLEPDRLAAAVRSLSEDR